MDVFANGAATRLESVDIYRPRFGRNEFDSLVKHNKSLVDVKIHISIMKLQPGHVRKNVTLDRVLDMTCSFLRCQKLQSLEIELPYSGDIHEGNSRGYFEPVREILCTKYCHRRSRVRIHGIEFY